MTKPNVELAACLDLAAADSLKEQLIGAIEQGGDVTLVCSAVEKIGTPCVQLIVAAGRTLAEAAHTITLEQPSDVLLTALTELGLSTNPDDWRHA